MKRKGQRFQIERVINKKGGFYSPLHFYPEDFILDHKKIKGPIVFKQYGKAPETRDECESYNRDEALLVIKDNQDLREKIHDLGVNVPRPYYWFFVSDSLSYLEAIEKCVRNEKGEMTSTEKKEEMRIVLLEEYTGFSLREMLRSTNRKYARDLLIALRETREALASTPDGLMLDSHPGNFTWDGQRISYFRVKDGRSFYPNLE